MDEYKLHLTKPEWLKVEQELDDAMYIQAPDGRVIETNDPDMVEIITGKKVKSKKKE